MVRGGISPHSKTSLRTPIVATFFQQRRLFCLLFVWLTKSRSLKTKACHNKNNFLNLLLLLSWFPGGYVSVNVLCTKQKGARNYIILTPLITNVVSGIMPDTSLLYFFIFCLRSSLVITICPCSWLSLVCCLLTLLHSY